MGPHRDGGCRARGPGEGWAEGAGLGWGSAVAGAEGRAAEESRAGESREGAAGVVQGWGSLKRKKVCAELCR